MISRSPSRAKASASAIAEVAEKRGHRINYFGKKRRLHLTSGLPCFTHKHGLSQSELDQISVPPPEMSESED
eukprot:3446627-Amphidinium_carterae.1